MPLQRAFTLMLPSISGDTVIVITKLLRCRVAFIVVFLSSMSKKPKQFYPSYPRSRTMPNDYFRCHHQKIKGNRIFSHYVCAVIIVYVRDRVCVSFIWLDLEWISIVLLHVIIVIGMKQTNEKCKEYDGFDKFLSKIWSFWYKTSKLVQREKKLTKAHISNNILRGAKSR